MGAGGSGCSVSSLCAGPKLNTTHDCLYLAFPPLKGGPSRPLLSWERDVTYTSGSSEYAPSVKPKEFGKQWQGKNYLGRIRRQAAEEGEMQTRRPVTSKLAFPCSSYWCGHLRCKHVNHFLHFTLDRLLAEIDFNFPSPPKLIICLENLTRKILL